MRLTTIDKKFKLVKKQRSVDPCVAVSHATDEQRHSRIEQKKCIFIAESSKE